MGSQLLVRSFSRHGYSLLLRNVDEVGEVLLPKSSVKGAAVNASAIIMAFIGVGLSMFSLSRLQNSSERRALITDVLKWPTGVRCCVYSPPSMLQRSWMRDCFCLFRSNALWCTSLFLVHRRLQYFIYVTRTICIYPRACSLHCCCRMMICIFRRSQQTVVCDDIWCSLKWCTDRDICSLNLHRGIFRILVCNCDGKLLFDSDVTTMFLILLIVRRKSAVNIYMWRKCTAVVHKLLYKEFNARNSIRHMNPCYSLWSEC